MKKTETDYKNKIITIPNALSLCRIILIPILVWLYCIGKYYWALGVFVVSALTDVVDGFIARKFNMISDLGKILDPIADKLTQGAVFFCLATRFIPMLILFVAMFIKELTVGISGIYMTKKSEKMYGANWHGKLNTVLFFVAIFFHLIWINIPITLSWVLCAICLTSMVSSDILYIIRNTRIVKQVHSGNEINLIEEKQEEISQEETKQEEN